jgi:hypothetical protein
VVEINRKGTGAYRIIQTRRQAADLLPLAAIFRKTRRLWRVIFWQTILMTA